ncbi:Choline transporter-like protein 1 [Tribolium castaneum]|uniref:Choline transporter-like protein n=1 Tax=Tribolium castaneum TaxID=7070 RepID=A0A139WKK7_TRICA|nr:Choline transporter-like protein 1 [Tribolium castaneum]
MRNVPPKLVRYEDDAEYKKQPVDPIYIFRGVSPSDSIALPEIPENRKCTDLVMGGIFLIAVLSLIGSSVYITSTSDIKILVNGADKCGNICGVSNSESDNNKNCPEKDYTNYPFLDVKAEECVTADQCKARNKTLYGALCMPEQRRTPKSKSKLFAGRDYNKSLENIVPYTIIVLILMPSVASGLSILVYQLLRSHPKCTFYFFTILSTIFFLLAACYFWYLFATRDHENVDKNRTLVLLTSAAGFTISEVYRETTKAIFHSKLVLLAPILTMVLVNLVGAIWLFMMLVTFSVKIPEGETLPGARTGYLIFLIFMGYWIFTFIEGCQCMMVAGTIASYYFSRDRDNLKGQYCYNVKLVIRFHLGSIATGALLITIAAMIRILIDSLTSYSGSDTWAWEIFRCMLLCIIRCLEEIVNYLTQKAYIMVAIHGKSFWTSGKRAVKLIWHNFLDTISVDWLNSAVEFSASALILFVTMLLGYAILSAQHMGFIIANLLFGGALAASALYVYFSLLSTAVGTIFLCYCEDLLINDGSRERPFFMSKEFQTTVFQALEFVVEKREERKREDA